MQPPSPPPLPTPSTAGRVTSRLAIGSLVLGILSMSCLGCFTGLPAILLGIIGLVKANKSNGTLGGQGLAIGGIITGFFGACFTTALVAALIIPSFAKAHDQSYKAVCLSHVKILAVNCQLYAEQHDNTLPPSLEELRPLLNNLTTDVFICLSAEDKTTPSYEIVGGGKKVSDKDPYRTVLIREIARNHSGLMAVGFLDGHAEFVSDETLNNLLAPAVSDTTPATPPSR